MLAVEEYIESEHVLDEALQAYESRDSESGCKQSDTKYIMEVASSPASVLALLRS